MGPPVATPVFQVIATAEPVAPPSEAIEQSPMTGNPEPPANLPSPPPVPTVPPAETRSPEAEVTRPTPPQLPADFGAESAIFLQEKIGRWTFTEARELLGDPLRQRAAIDDNQVENGQIYAFHDPTGRYKEMELDFDAAKGRLRTVFVYPYQLTWQECRRLFSGTVNTTRANKGRTFYSYLNRRLDVLVDSVGQVISLGLY
jgi:hypothetical protein